jgi:hypothetical protein
MPFFWPPIAPIKNATLLGLLPNLPAPISNPVSAHQKRPAFHPKLTPFCCGLTPPRPNLTRTPGRISLKAGLPMPRRYPPHPNAPNLAIAGVPVCLVRDRIRPNAPITRPISGQFDTKWGQHIDGNSLKLLILMDITRETKGGLGPGRS